MIIVMKPEVAPDGPEVHNVLDRARRGSGVEARVCRLQGATRPLTEIYLLGQTGQLSPATFDGMAGVDRVARLTDKFCAIGRHDADLEPVGFEYGGVRFSQDTFHVFPGLCAVDTPEHVDAMFRELSAHGVVTARAGAYKPRTSPYDFQGHGDRCLPYVLELAGKHGIRVIAMEVTHESHVRAIVGALETSGRPTSVMLQIGTRNAQNFELLKAVGRQSDLPVLFKRGMGITLEDSLNACEYIAASGNRKIVFGLRGVRTHLGDPHRNFVDFAHVPVIKRMTRLPVCIDPSHSVGGRDVAPDGLLDIMHASAQGIIAGANMVLVDFHPHPEQALCDGRQALRIDELPHFLDDVALLRETYGARLALAQKHARTPAVSCRPAVAAR